MVGEMKVGQKVQAIIPPELAFGEKGEQKGAAVTMIAFSPSVQCSMCQHTVDEASKF